MKNERFWNFLGGQNLQSVITDKASLHITYIRANIIWSAFLLNPCWLSRFWDGWCIVVALWCELWQKYIRLVGQMPQLDSQILDTYLICRPPSKTGNLLCLRCETKDCKLFNVYGIKAACSLLLYYSNIVIMNKSIRRKGNCFKSTEGISIHSAVIWPFAFM